MEEYTTFKIGRFRIVKLLIVAKVDPVQPHTKWLQNSVWKRTRQFKIYPEMQRTKNSRGSLEGENWRIHTIRYQDL